MVIAKRCVLVLLIFLLSTMTIACEQTNTSTTDKSTKLIVNGESIECDAYVKIYHDNADLPLLAIIKALGGNVVWDSSLVAIIEVNNKLYTFDSEQLTLYENDHPSINLFHLVFGGTTFVHSIEKDVLVDSTLCKNILLRMGENVCIELDYNNSTIIIERI